MRLTNIAALIKLCLGSGSDAATEGVDKIETAALERALILAELSLLCQVLPAIKIYKIAPAFSDFCCTRGVKIV